MIIHEPYLRPHEVPQKMWARLVQPFWRLLDTKKTDRQAKFIHRLTPWNFLLSFYQHSTMWASIDSELRVSCILLFNQILPSTLNKNIKTKHYNTITKNMFWIFSQKQFWNSTEFIMSWFEIFYFIWHSLYVFYYF